MKKLSLLLVLAVAIMAVGCGKKEEAAAPATAPDATAAAPATKTDPNAAVGGAATTAPPQEATNTGVQDVKPTDAGTR